jgi:hypothetical protein
MVRPKGRKEMGKNMKYVVCFQMNPVERWAVMDCAPVDGGSLQLGGCLVTSLWKALESCNDSPVTVYVNRLTGDGLRLRWVALKLTVSLA